MDFHRCPLVVVESGALELRIVECESEWLDKVQLGSRVCTQPDHVARIRRYFRFVKHYF